VCHRFGRAVRAYFCDEQRSSDLSWSQ
jgi:hypothetical protein